MTKKKVLTILGHVWDFWPVLKEYDRVYDSKFISFYNPWLKGDINKNKIIEFNEKNQSIFLWPFKIISRTFKIIKFYFKFKPDYIVTHHDDANLSVLSILFILKFILRKDIKFIAYIRAGESYYHSEGFYPNFIKKFGKYFYSKFDLVLTPSIGNKIELKKLFKLKNINHKYNPVDIKSYLSRSEEKEIISKEVIEFTKDSKVFLTIGRLTEQKALWYLIRIFKKLVKTKPNSKLLIIGDGELKAKLEEQVRSFKLENNIMFLGQQKNVYPYIKLCDCFVLTSLWESFGNVLVESLALNKMIISTDSKSGPREILCPEISYNKKLKYPYFGNYGILTKPFKRKYVYENPSQVALSKEEEILLKLLKEVTNGKFNTKYNNGIERIKEFDIDYLGNEKSDNIDLLIFPNSD